MEKKIKLLYILSIAAIVAFLAMQAFWLYGRYEYNLRIAEDDAREEILDAVERYRVIRNNIVDTLRGDYTYRTNYNIDHSTDSTGRTVSKASVVCNRYNAYRLLGIHEDRPLTLEEKLRAADLVHDHAAGVELLVQSYEAHNAPSEGAIWSAVKNVELEWWKVPFTPEGLDSLLRERGISARISLAVTDTMVWIPAVTRHSSPWNPRLSVSVPYSELERKSVVVDWPIPVSDTLRRMAVTLVAAFFISLLLILCLVWQLSAIVRLNRLDSMRNKFITTMIHELKRPIYTLKMCVSGFGNDAMREDTAMRDGLIDESRRAIGNLSACFSRLRDITFNRTDQIPLNISTFPLRPLVDDVVASLIVPSGKEVTFHIDIPLSVTLSADASHTFNILVNLMENAVKYSGPEVTITVTAAISEHLLTLSVADTGHGISASDRRNIFRRFYRGTTSADTPGMGLGLTYVRLLAEAHGGSVTVDSTPGAGSVFSVIFPQ